MHQGRRAKRQALKALAALAALALISFLAIACGGDSSSDAGDGGGDSSAGETTSATDTTTASSEPIVLGASVPLTGPLAGNGERLKKAYEFAIEEINAAGGINGSEVSLKIEDDKADPAVATSVTKKLIEQDKVNALLGTYGSPAALAASAVAEQYKIPNIQAFGSAPEMVERGLEYLFNTYPLASQSEDVMQKYLAENLKPKTAAMIYLDNPYALGGAEAQRKGFEAIGTEIVLDEKIETGQSDYTSVLSKLRGKDLDALMFIVYPPDELVLMKQLKQLDINPKLVYMNAASGFEPHILEALGGLGDWVVGTPEWFAGAPLPEADEVAAAFEEKVGEPASIETYKGVQAVRILANAVEQAGGAADPEALREALAATDFSPLGSQVTFEPNGQMDTTLFVAQLQDGKGVALAPEDKAQGELVEFPAWKSR